MKGVRIFCSMPVMIILGLFFVIILASATFIEHAYGPETARALIYNARWMEGFYLLLAINLIGNGLTHQMRKKGNRIWYFHLSFFLILTGAGLTRYLGSSGQLHFRTGEQTDQVLSDKAYLQIEASGKKAFSGTYPLILSSATRNRWQTRLGPEGSLHIRLEDYIQHAGPVIREDPEGTPVFALRVSDGRQTVPLVFRSGDRETWGGWTFVFDSAGTITGKGIRFGVQGSDLMIEASEPLTLVPMTGEQLISLQAGRCIPIRPGLLIRGDRLQFALESFFMKGRVSAAGAEQQSHEDLFSAITVSLSRAEPHESGSKRVTKRVTLFGGAGLEGIPVRLRLQELQLQLTYGALPMTLPFSLQLEHFIIERYPGSRMPSSYESQVVILDPGRGIRKSFRIYMNHILKYRGYRFYQSSYDEDERGSILTVTRDPGTPVMYAGYIFVVLLSLVSLFDPRGRFRQLGKKLRSQAILFPVIAGLLMPGTVFSQTRSRAATVIDKAHARAFGRLLVQDTHGRFKPMICLAQELSDQLGHPEKEQNLSYAQWILYLFIQPTVRNIPLIPVNKTILERLSADDSGHFAAASQFYDPGSGRFLLADLVGQAQTKSHDSKPVSGPGLMNLGRQLQLVSELEDHSYFRCFPISAQTDRWESDRSEKLSETLEKIIADYKASVRSHAWNKATDLLGEMIGIQNETSGQLLSSAFRREIEILYGRIRLFQKLGPFQLGLGLIGMLLLLLTGRRNRKRLHHIVFLLLVATFITQSLGLGLRWIAAGHAPWTNKYESLIYIAWTIMFAGLLFVKDSPITILLAAVLSGAFLLAAHSGWADPQLTNLVPVLKSHWLITHVSVITASYGFFSLSALMGFSVLVLILLKPGSDTLSLAKTLTWTNERSLLIGLVLVTIGNLLGAVWANESWGRYWGWDPKETWTLILIVIYAMLTHLRLAKNNNFMLALNSAAMFAYWAVLMTYIGVNFYLSGVHSYASGEAPPLPKAVFLLFGVQVFISVGAWMRVGGKKIIEADPGNDRITNAET
jgi:cytochrome c-type biogenesis protein CcsB